MTRPSNPVMDRQIGLSMKALDHGFVRLVDYMGDDAAVVQAARVSYGSGTKTVNEDRGLLRYLLRQRHTTPFEMCEIKLHVKLPVFVARQWIRHRTANVNEYSARYSILDNEFYIPETDDIMPQSKTNKQGRDGALPEDVRNAMRETISMHSASSYDLYEELHTGWPWFHADGNRVSPDEDIDQHDEGHGLAREMSRMVLPPNIYTQWYWKVDLHNLLHFLSLRADPHAQYEIRVYADLICDLVRQWCPMTFEAFEDYVMYAQRFSRMDMEALKHIAANTPITTVLEAVANMDSSERERGELLTKLGVQRD